MGERTLLFAALVHSAVPLVCAAQSDDPAVLNNLGSRYYSAGRYTEAEPLLNRAVEIWSADSAAQPQFATALHNLAAVYRAQGRFAEALPLYERALELRQAVAGPNDPTLLPLLNNLALLYRDLADLNRARRTAARAISIAESQGVVETADGAAGFRALGAVLEAQGRIAEAKVALRRAMAIDERVLGPDHPSTADTINELALAYRHEGQWNEAARLYRRALAIYQAAPNSSQVPVALNNLAQTLAAQRQRNEAERLFRQALAESEKRYGPDHPDVAAELAGLADLLGSRHKYAEAERLLSRAQKIDRRRFPPDHPQIAYDLIHAADLAFERKQYGQSEDLLHQALAILNRTFAPNHPEIGKATASLAEIRRCQRRLDESEELYRHAVAILEQAWGPENPQLLTILERYSLVLRAREQYAQAAGVDTRVMKIRVSRTLRNPAGGVGPF